MSQQDKEREALLGFALRFKGYWVGIWNDADTAEFMKSKYKKSDAAVMEVVPMQAARSQPPSAAPAGMVLVPRAALENYHGPARHLDGQRVYLKALNEALEAPQQFSGTPAEKRELGKLSHQPDAAGDALKPEGPSALLRTAPGGFPMASDRFVMVPVEPTKKMLEAAQVAAEDNLMNPVFKPGQTIMSGEEGAAQCNAAVYRAMLSAAPQPPVAQPSDTVVELERRLASIEPRQFAIDVVPIARDAIAECRRLAQDARRWRWLRECQGWPDSEAAVSGFTPEQFDSMADAALDASQQGKGA